VMSVSVSPRAYLRNQIFCGAYATYTAVARFSSDGVTIRYVLPVFWMTSRLHIMARNKRREKGIYSK